MCFIERMKFVRRLLVPLSLVLGLSSPVVNAVDAEGSSKRVTKVEVRSGTDAKPDVKSSTAKSSSNSEGASSEEILPVPRLESMTPPSEGAIDEHLLRGAAFLLKTQNKDGSWGDHTLTKGLNILCPPPGGPLAFRAATTSLDVIGLMSAAPQFPQVQESLDKAEAWLLDNLPKIKRTDDLTLYNVWGHAYGIRALCVLAERVSPESERYETLKKECANQIKRLGVVQDKAGGWGYLEFDYFNSPPQGLPTSFTTATVLLALKEAEKTFGLKPEGNMVDRALKFLLKQRTPVGTYVYSISHMKAPVGLINRQTGSLARTPVCNAALYAYNYGDISLKDIEDGLDWMWARGGWLDMSRKKPVPHESFAANSGYFFYYGYFYAAMSISVLPKDKQARHASFLSHTLLPLQEKDGSWWDYPLYNYHKPYGTGYALYSLSDARGLLYGNKFAPDAKIEPFLTPSDQTNEPSAQPAVRESTSK